MFGIKYLFLSAHINEHPKKNEPSMFKTWLAPSDK